MDDLKKKKTLSPRLKKKKLNTEAEKFSIHFPYNKNLSFNISVFFPLLKGELGKVACLLYIHQVRNLKNFLN